ncbi:unnamed protein product [Caenorhabditis bovis]|uniref:Phlebovirus glycoprotein G2 fusion domain-containing protein n=1 Tax=Caenorhabditis bovis TaxID=2654633 RepID=A0A8S1ERQ8_9PELO|nr:unnamed protein product [Caenorhabditis bovis]
MPALWRTKIESLPPSKLKSSPIGPNAARTCPSPPTRFVITPAWKRFSKNKDREAEKNCPPRAQCSKIKFWMCKDVLMNPHCAPITFSIMCGIMIFILVIVPIWTLVKKGAIMSCCKRAQRDRETPIKGHKMDIREQPKDHKNMITKCPKNAQIDDATERLDEPIEADKISQSSKSSLWEPSMMIGIVCIIIVVPGVYSCDKIIPISHTEAECVNNLCRVRSIQDIFVHPLVNTVCIQIMNKDQIITKMSVKIDYAVRKCIKGHVTLTRNSTIVTQSQKRCGGNAMCKGTKCEKVHKDTYIPDLGEANKYPGHSHCADSCGGWGCGCLSLTAACLFYRNYAIPTSDEVVEIYKCENWSKQIAVTIEVNERFKPEPHHLMVQEDAEEKRTSFLYKEFWYMYQLKTTKTIIRKLKDVSEMIRGSNSIFQKN